MWRRAGGTQLRGNSPAFRARVLESFASHGRSQVQSFRRKRECAPQAIRNTPPTDWIPAFAGMTIVSKGIPFQMNHCPAPLDISRIRARVYVGEVAGFAACRPVGMVAFAVAKFASSRVDHPAQPFMRPF
jgi:hypothetical protein